MGEKPEVLREDYPHVPEEAYPVAVPWAHANPRRGRPVRPWDDAAGPCRAEASCRAGRVKFWTDECPALALRLPDQLDVLVKSVDALVPSAAFQDCSSPNRTAQSS